MKKNPNLALSIDVFLKNIVNTNFGSTGRYIMSWARDIFTVLSLVHVHIVYLSNLLLVSSILKISLTNYRRALKEDKRMTK